MRTVAIIPARLASSRFPGKPMALIHGMPMIGHCYCRIRLCPALADTYVATCDEEIYDYILSIGGKAVMTADTHERASDRAAEAMVKVEEACGEKTDILVMVQGDEPMDTPEMVSEALLPMLQNDSIQIVNLMGRIETLDEFEDPNIVKVVVDSDSNAIYFSREPIPSRKKGVDTVPMRKQIAVIPFRRDFLVKFNRTPEMPLEIIESVDMLGVIESGGQVRMVMTEYQSIGVDTPEQLQSVEKLMENDPLMRKYLY
jgi:3-deoxy-manno-octulosonate cytidylyltransferase (CMP-KDO synthetase)